MIKKKNIYFFEAGQASSKSVPSCAARIAGSRQAACREVARQGELLLCQILPLVDSPLPPPASLMGNQEILYSWSFSASALMLLSLCVFFFGVKQARPAVKVFLVARPG